MQTYNSSTLKVEVGTPLISKTQYQAWFRKNETALKRQACDEIYNSLNSKESNRVRAEMQQAGVAFLEPLQPSFDDAPDQWEIESYEPQPQNGGKLLVSIRKRRDAYSYTRIHLYESELHQEYTGQTLQELIDRDLEQTRSLWLAKSKHVQRADVATRTEQLVQSSQDELSKAAHEVAKFETASNSEKADLMSDPRFRSKLMRAKAAVNAARNFS